MIASFTSSAPSAHESGPLRLHPLSADPDALKPFNESTPEWRETALRLEALQPRLWKSFTLAVNLAACGAMVATGAAVIGLTPLLLPSAPLLWAALAAVVPAALLGLAAGHAAGGLVLARVTGLSPESRRLFALRLGASRAPSRWPAWFSRWLFTGDWLAMPRPWEKAPYLRAFVTGAPGGERDELRWWETVIQQLDGRAGVSGHPWEAGATHFEMGYSESLPNWTRGLPDGATLGHVIARTGASTRTWAKHFWRRATLRTLGLGDPELVEESAFRFYRVRLEPGREALVVTLRPQAAIDAASEVEVLTIHPDKRVSA